MTITTHERPGVYSVYTASALIGSAARKGVAAIAAVSAGGTVGEVYTVGNYSEAVAQFGADDGLTELVRLLLLNGAVRVVAAPVRGQEEYADAFALLNAQDGVNVVTCDSAVPAVQTALRESVAEAAKCQRERIAVVCGGLAETVEQLTARAKGLNSERMVLTAPAAAGDGETTAAMVAAAVAGAICAESDPAVPLGGAELRGLSGLVARYGEEQVDTLIQGGVTPVEMVGGRCTVIRGVTTRTTTGGTEDRTWQELSTILVIDDVVPGVRRALQAKFTRSKNTQQVRGAIRSQVILELERKKAAEILTDYGEVTAQALEDRPAVCLVTFSFAVAHGLNQIWLSAQITV